LVTGGRAKPCRIEIIVGAHDIFRNVDVHHAGPTHTGFAQGGLNGFGNAGVARDVAAPLGDGSGGVNLRKILKCAAPVRVADAFTPGAGN
jgi:hypothetical protein